MNYLSHHFIALQTGNGDSFFFSGNVIPDLLAHDGEGRLQDRHIAGNDSPFAQGIALHLAADRRFHLHPAFKEASAEASALLRAAPFSVPLRRVFFLAHVFVEIALDGRTLTKYPGIADHLYAQLELSGVERLTQRTAELLNVAPDSLPNLASSLTWFLTRRYVSAYGEPHQQAEALHRISRRVQLPGFPDRADHRVLEQVFAAFAPRLSQWEDALLTPP